MLATAKISDVPRYLDALIDILIGDGFLPENIVLVFWKIFVTKNFIQRTHLVRWEITKIDLTHLNSPSYGVTDIGSNNRAALWGPESNGAIYPE